MANTCTFHPTKPSPYHCPKCDTNYCVDCVSKRTGTQGGKRKDFYFCPKCNLPVEMLAVGSFIEPFWNRLHKFFLYPLQLRPLILIGALSLASAALYWVPFINLVLGVIFIKYSFEVLRKTANGSLEAPELSYEVLGQDLEQAFKQVALFYIMGIAVVLVFIKLGVFVGFLFLVFAVLLTPAMIIVLAISKSLISALNPLSYVTIAWRIGAGYLIMYAFLILLLSAPGALYAYVLRHLPVAAGHFVFSVANLYYTIIAYSLMGYIMLQYHMEIGFEVETEQYREQRRAFEISAPAAQDSGWEDNLMSEVNILIKSGRAEDALTLMKGRLRGKQPDLSMTSRYYNLLKVTGKTAELPAHGIVHLDLLTADNEKDDSLEVYKECLSLDPQFTPNPEALFKLAGWLMDDDPRYGLNALGKFMKTYPTHALAPKALFILAKAVNEKLNDPARAEKMFRALMAKYPDHDLAAHAGMYVQRLEEAKARVG